MKIIYVLSGTKKEDSLFTKEQETMIKEDLKGATNLVAIGACKTFEENDLYFYGNDTAVGTISSFKFSDLKNFNLLDKRISKEKGAELLKNADIIYLQGGDPFIQLEYLRNNNYDKIIRNFNGIILGLSAGSMNLSKTSFYSKDEDYPESKFYKGLGLINLTIDPHFDINDESRIEEAKKYSIINQIIGLPDYSAIIIKGNEIINFGPNYRFENGDMIQ